MFPQRLFYSLLQKKGGLDLDYQAVLNYGISQGWTLPSSATQTKDNTMILALKSAGIWSKLDIFYMFSTDGDSNFARINWKSPGNFVATLLGNIPPTFTTNLGFTGNATNLAYVSTNFNPSTNGVQHTLNNASRHFWKGDAVATGIMDGNTSAIQSIQTASTGNQRINQTAQVSSAYSYGATVGMKSIHRTSSNDVTLITNTTAATRTAASSTTNYSLVQWILRSGTTYANHSVRMYSMGASLVSENTAYFNAINTRMA